MGKKKTETTEKKSMALGGDALCDVAGGYVVLLGCRGPDGKWLGNINKRFETRDNAIKYAKDNGIVYSGFAYRPEGSWYDNYYHTDRRK